MKVTFASTGIVSPDDAVVVFIGGDPVAPHASDQAEGQALARLLSRGRFTGKSGEIEVLTEVGDAGWLVAVGTAEASDISGPSPLEEACAKAYHTVKDRNPVRLVLRLPDSNSKEAAYAAAAIRLAAYRFDRHRTTSRNGASTISAVLVLTPDPGAAERAYVDAAAVADGVLLARDLVNEPPNVLYPQTFADRCEGLRSAGLEVDVLGHAELEALGLRMLLGVGKGSANESKVVTLSWRGADAADSPPVAFVGKGVTFDTGGLSLKAPDAMEAMKMDMAGAAAVVGAMQVLAVRKARLNVVGVIGLVENMPDGAAQRPSDVVVSLSGQTVEIVNTDAEGRLVLGDALWFCKERFRPRCMIDLATLTGTMGIALGPNYAGLFANDDRLAACLETASVESGELLWRMPMPAAYDHMLESPVADMKNRTGKTAGHVTAALFLKRFVGDVPWAHLDIAPTAWRDNGRIPTIPQGPSGFGVRLLDSLVRQFERDAQVV